MNDSNRSTSSRSVLRNLTHLFAVSLLLCSWSAQATAPRVAPKLIGEVKQVDVIGYYSGQSTPAAEAEGKLTGDLLEAAFHAGGIQPNIDVLPSKQLAKYEFVVNQVPAMIITANDLSRKELKRYHTVTYFLSDVAHASNPVSLAFDLKNPHGDKLYKAFNKGLQMIIKNGTYLDVMQRHLGKTQIPENYILRLQRQNPGWK